MVSDPATDKTRTLVLDVRWGVGPSVLHRPQLPHCDYSSLHACKEEGGREENFLSVCGRDLTSGPRGTRLGGQGPPLQSRPSLRDLL